MKRRAFAFLLALSLLLLPFLGLCESALLAVPSRSIAILLLGVDKPVGETLRAAAIVIAALNLDTGAVRLASIDRNTLIPGPNGDATLADTVALGGSALALQTVKELYGINITRFVTVDLSGMEKIIDALGGVDIDVREGELNIWMADGKTKVFEQTGLQTLGGAQAMSFMRDHTGEEKGSSRLSRVLTACMQKGIQMGLDPLIELIMELIEHVETNMTLMDMMEVALSALSASVSGMETKHFPMNGHTASSGKETAVRMLDSKAETEALYAFLFGETVMP